MSGELILLQTSNLPIHMEHAAWTLNVQSRLGLKKKVAYTLHVTKAQ